MPRRSTAERLTEAGDAAARAAQTVLRGELQMSKLKITCKLLGSSLSEDDTRLEKGPFASFEWHAKLGERSVKFVARLRRDNALERWGHCPEGPAYRAVPLT